MGGGSQPWNGRPVTQAEEDDEASTAGEDAVLSEDEDGMEASAVPNQALVSQCSLVTLWDGVLVVFVSYTARQSHLEPFEAI